MSKSGPGYQIEHHIKIHKFSDYTWQLMKINRKAHCWVRCGYHYEVSLPPKQEKKKKKTFSISISIVKAPMLVD